MATTIEDDIQSIQQFLQQPTPEAWLTYAVRHIPLLLIDHAHCERKAAVTAINLMSKYPEKQELVVAMSRLAREELLHFEKVLDLLKTRGIVFCSLKPCIYAQRLHQQVTNKDYVERIVDQLIVGALIEARSCERFAALIPYLNDHEPELAKFYLSLVKAEARHFQDYINLAELYLGSPIQSRLVPFRELENKLICGNEKNFRFHGGMILS